MAWLGGKDPRVQQLRDILEQESRVAQRAVRYHRLRERLLDDLRRFQRRRLPRLGQREEAERLLRRGDRLREVAGQLRELLEQVDALQQSVQDLQRRAASMDDLAQPFGERCRQWSEALNRLGSMAGRPAELNRDQADLQHIQGQCRLHSQALELVVEAEGRAGHLQGEDRHSWQEQLRARRQEMADGPLDRKMVQGLRRWLEEQHIPAPEPPAEELPPLPPSLPPQPPAAPPPAPPQPVEEALAEDSADSDAQTADAEPQEEISDESADAPAAPEAAPIPPEEAAQVARRQERAADLLDEARVWLRELGDGPQQLQQLQQRFGKTPVQWEDWEGSQSRKYLQAVEELVEQLRERASFMRREKRHFLREYVREYRRLLDSDEGLKDHLQDLERLSADSPEKHARWLEVAEEVESRFRGTAALHQDRLQECLAERLAALRDEADEFGKDRLFQEDRQRLDEIRQQIDQAGRLDNLDSVLLAMLANSRLQSDLKELKAEVEESRKRHLQSRTSLLSRNRELTRAGERAEIPLENLQESIQKIEVRTSSQTESRQQAEQRIQNLSERLDEQQQRLIEGCRQQIDELRSRCREVASALQPISEAPNLEGLPPGLPADAELEPVVSALEQARPACHRAEAALQEAIDQLERKRQEIRRDLEALPASVPYGQDRRSRHLQKLFEEDSFQGIQDPLLLLDRLRKAVEKGEAFRDSFYRRQRQVQEYRRNLPRRLTELEGQGLQRYAPRFLLDRITALIEGVGPSPADWQRAVHQLEEAEKLLARLERHARRLAPGRELR